jgi:hypothetical protein
MHNFIFRLFFSDQVAHACASCGLAGDSNSYYLLLIAVMTSIPLLLVGATVLYIRKAGGAHDIDEK